MSTRVAIYPGSFDPPTHGHVDIVRRAMKVFDHVIVAVATNINKNHLFTIEERVEAIQAIFADCEGVEVDSFGGLLVDYLRRKGASVVVRGLRAVADFEYEFQMATVNRKLYPKIEMLYMMSGEEYFYVSSQVVREVAKLGGPLADFVPKVVEERLKRKLGV